MTSAADITTNILLVDDRAQNLLALEAILEPLGQNLVYAESGEQALKHLLERDFAVILLDVLMPGMDGFETAAMIKEREKTRHTPIIFLTAVSQQEPYVFRGYDVGAVDYISKPFDPDVLRSKVAVFVDLYRKTEQIRRQSELLRESEQRERIRLLEEQKRLDEERYRELAESMPQLVWTTDAKGELNYCNQRCTDFTGVSSEKLREHGWATVLHDEDAAAFTRGIQDALETATRFEASCRLRHASDGTYRWHLLRVVPIRTPAGTLSSWIGTGTDIDDHKRTAEALSFLAEASTILSDSLDYRAALKRLPKLAVPKLADWCAIDLVDDHGRLDRIASLHRDAERLVHHRDPDLAGSLALLGNWRPRLDPSSVLIPDVEAALREPDHPWAEKLQRLRRADLGSYVRAPVCIRNVVIGAVSLGIGPAGRRLGQADQILCEDLARRIASAIDNARLYEIAEREREELERANRAKDEFLAVVSHELRSPLNSVLGWTQLLRTGKLDPNSSQHALETIERNARAQAKLIGDLLDVSRIITGKLSLRLRTIDLRSILQAALDSVRPAADAKSIQVITSIDPALPPLIGDPDRLQQVVWNLLSNAIKFTPREGRIEIDLQSTGDHVVLRMTDTGIGIEQDFLPHVFERFRQADGSTTRIYGGLGLGLSIVRHLTELHGGEVWATSEGKGLGATFVIRLPIRSANQSAAAEPTPKPSAPREGELAGLRVLVVDDLRDSRELVGVMLQSAGASVTTVSNIREALDAIASEVPDLLLSDIGLAGESGFELLEQIRQLEPEQGGTIPAIALTAYASESDRERALACGFQSHMAKPFEREALVGLIRRIAAASRP